MLTPTTLLALALAWAQALPTPVLSRDYPPDGPRAADVALWSRVQGDVETAELRVLYELLTNPERPGLYAVTRYRVTRRSQVLPSGAAGDDRTESEKLIWNARPGSREPLRCFARADDGTWRALAHDTPEFKREMGTAISIYMLHRRALLEREDDNR